MSAGLVLQQLLRDILTWHVAAASLVNRRTATPAVDARAGRGTNAGAVHVSDHNMTGATRLTRHHLKLRPRATSQENAIDLHSDSSRPPHLAMDSRKKKPLPWPIREFCAPPSAFLS